MASSSQRIATLFDRITDALGSPAAVAAAFALIISWAATGPLLKFSSSWQLVINTTTTIITFLMVFIIQETQNRDNKAMHIKLDAIMKALGIDEENLMDLEHKPDAEIKSKEKEIKS